MVQDRIVTRVSISVGNTLAGIKAQGNSARAKCRLFGQG